MSVMINIERGSNTECVEYGSTAVGGLWHGGSVLHYVNANIM